MQGLREAADVVQSGLSDIANFGEFSVEWRSLGNLPAGAAEENADCGEHLAKFVVQFAGDVTKRGLLSVDEFLGEFAALRGEGFQAGKNFAIGIDEVKAGEHDRDERGAEQNIELTLNTVVDFGDLVGGLLFAFVVLHQEPRDSGAERGLASLQCKLDLIASFFFFSGGS